MNDELNKKKASFFRQTEQIYHEQQQVLGDRPSVAPDLDANSDDGDDPEEAQPRANLFGSRDAAKTSADELDVSLEQLVQRLSRPRCLINNCN